MQRARVLIPGSLHDVHPGFGCDERGASGAAMIATSNPRSGIHLGLLSAALVALVFTAVRLPYWSHTNLDPDAISYWSTGRSLVEGHGFCWPIKLFYCPDDGIVLQPAVGHLSVPFCLLLSLGQYLGMGFRQATFLNSVICLVGAWLVYWLVDHFCGPIPALLATLLYVTSPELVTVSVTLLTEPAEIALSLGALAIAAHLLEHANITPGQPDGAISSPLRLECLACGVVLLLGSLVRPAGITNLVAVVCVLLLWRRRFVPWVVAGYLTAGMPYWIANTIQNGRPFYTMYALLGRMLFYGQATYLGFNHVFPTPLELLKGHSREIAASIERNIHLCHSLLALPQNMGALGPAALVALAGLAVSQRLTSSGLASVGPRRHCITVPAILLLFVAGGLNLTFNVAVWSTHEESRFVLTSWAPLLVLCAALLGSLPSVVWHGQPVGSARPVTAVRRTLAIVLAAGAILAWWMAARASLSACLDARKDDFASNGQSWREAQVAEYAPICRYIRRQSSYDTVIAACDPSMVNYLSDRPSAQLPALRQGELPQFLSRYHVRWVVLDPHRVPCTGAHDDFAQEARTHRDRDWYGAAVTRSPLLQQVMVLGKPNFIHLYRVLPIR
jgi:hypothetical protein